MAESDIQSMTGFGSATCTIGGLEAGCDVRSVNGRSLDIKMRLPAGLESAEPALRKRISARLTRGNVQATISVASGNPAEGAGIDVTLFRRLAAEAAALSIETGLAPPTTDGLLAVRGVVGQAEASMLDAEAIPEIQRLLDEALDALVAGRRAEGAALAGTVGGQIDTIELLTRKASAEPGSQPDAIMDRLKIQIEKLLADRGEGMLDPQRLQAEAALLATKADITEELDRLSAHVKAARTLLKQGGPVGRKFDFLAQEFNREANTLCAKSPSSALTAVGLELKSVIDQLREQVQNLQ